MRDSAAMSTPTPPSTPALDWDRELRLTRSLLLEVSADGKGFAAHASLSRPAEPVGPDALLILREFLPGATPRQAWTRFSETWDVDEATFGRILGRLAGVGLLAAPGEALPDGGPGGSRGGYASAGAHHHMLRDAIRVLQYREAIRRHAPGKRVLEIGCGSGILSLLAAKAGARSVTAIEETSIGELALAMFEANGERLTLLRGNSRDVTPPEPAELVVHELIGDGPLNESILEFVDDARRRFLAPGGRFLPSALEVRCVGYETTDLERLLGEVRSFEALYGLSFAPFAAELRAAHARGEPLLTGHGQELPRILTEEAVLRRVEFAEPAPALEPHRVRLRASAAGRLDGAVVYFAAWLDEQTVLSNSPFHPQTHWLRRSRPFARRLEVRPGAEVEVEVRYVRRDTGLEVMVEPV